MAKIFISFASEDRFLAQNLAQHLMQYDHHIYLDVSSELAEKGIKNALTRQISNSDVFLSLVTKNSINSKFFKTEFDIASSLRNFENKNSLIVSVIFDRDIFHNMGIRAGMALYADENDLNKTADDIIAEIELYNVRKSAESEKLELREKVLKEESSDYINETVDDLKSRETRGRILASRWHIAGYIALIISVIFVFIVWWLAEKSIGQSPISNGRLAFDAIKGITVIALVLGIARYSFLMAKTHYIEALKNADRLHAISFGKFYMRVFSKQITSEEIKEVFQHWNTSGTNDLTHLDVDKIDSRVVEIFNKISDKFNDTKK
ncbi:toll/interleukin-1 receptor domain-containing protein [Pantoea stewartii]|uniref:toll/interleukin-1 receptor domain-containing protein n=1 Tax=Pantoea stewartii TaxID=66269 RepID=UPI00345C17CA